MHSYYRRCDMYDIIRSVIDSKNYELSDILSKIKRLWVENEISDEQKDELMTLAREKANAANSYAPLQEQIDKLALEVKALRAEVAALKNGGSTEEEPTEEYPPFVQPTGSHDAYNTGGKCSENGKRYECIMDGCVWPPSVYPQGWREVTEVI